MLLAWRRKNQSHIEPRQELARKLLELNTKYNGVPEQKPDFKTLAQELDIHGMLCVVCITLLINLYFVFLTCSTIDKFSELNQ